MKDDRSPVEKAYDASAAAKLQMLDEVIAALQEERDNSPKPRIWGMSIVVLGMPDDQVDRLRSNHIDTVGELVSFTADKLHELPNIGMKTLDWVRDSLKKHGLKLKGD